MEEKICVSVKTQEEWDKVIKTIRPTDYYNSFTRYSEICIDLKDGSYCGCGWFIKHEYTIISYQDWLYYGPSIICPKSQINPILIHVPKI